MKKGLNNTLLLVNYQVLGKEEKCNKSPLDCKQQNFIAVYPWEDQNKISTVRLLNLWTPWGPKAVIAGAGTRPGTVAQASDKTRALYKEVEDKYDMQREDDEPEYS